MTVVIFAAQNTSHSIYIAASDRADGTSVTLVFLRFEGGGTEFVLILMESGRSRSPALLLVSTQHIQITLYVHMQRAWQWQLLPLVANRDSSLRNFPYFSASSSSLGTNTLQSACRQVMTDATISCKSNTNGRTNFLNTSLHGISYPIPHWQTQCRWLAVYVPCNATWPFSCKVY